MIVAGGKQFLTEQDCRTAGFQPEEIEFIIKE